MPPRLTIVVPVHNEEHCLGEFHRRLLKVLDSLDLESRVLFVDDGSRDGFLDRIREIAAADRRFGFIALARNFGHQAALTAGLHRADGDAVILMDADLQDPPEIIPRFVETWRAGYHVVYGTRLSREREVWFKRLTAFVFYRLFNLFSEVPTPRDAGEFCLLDKSVVAALNRLPERNRYLRGLRSWVGFRQGAVHFHRETRFAGRSNYSLRKSAGLALDAVLSLSKAPLTLPLAGGTLLGVLALALLPWLPPLFCAHLGLFAFQLFCFGLLGLYLGRVYDEVRGRPLYTIAESEGAG